MKTFIIIGPMPIYQEIAVSDLNKFIFVDGGINHNKFLEVDNFTSIGDQDSTQTQLEITLPKEKDRSDLHHALELTHSKPSDLIELHGFLGGRRDHEFINFGEAINHTRTRGSQINFIDHKGKLVIKVLPKGKSTFSHNGLISLVSTCNQIINLEGQLKYRGSYSFSPWSSQGLSNEASGQFTLDAKDPILLFL